MAPKRKRTGSSSSAEDGSSREVHGGDGGGSGSGSGSGSTLTSPPSDTQAQAQALAQVACPYLDTVNRSVLDFDMEKVCSVSLSTQNVYCCLVCGKFLAGRGKATPAYTHSVQHGHFVFLNLTAESVAEAQTQQTQQTQPGRGRFYCLPDNYEIVDPSLDDIKFSLAPTYSPADIARLENDNRDLSRDQHGASYLPGFLGLNNLGCTDYVNAAVRALSHVRLFRNYFLRADSIEYKQCRSVLVHRLGDCLRRLWSPRSLKSNVSPQGLVNAVSTATNTGTNRRFQLSNSSSGKAGGSTECMDFFNWLLSEVHRALTLTTGAAAAATTSTSGSSSSSSSSAKASSIVTDCFQGVVEVTEQRRRAGAAAGAKAGADDVPWKESKRRVPFQHLSLDLPPPPLFKEGDEQLIIPTVNIYELLKKFDGKQWTETLRGEEHVRRRYRILKLPPVLVFHLVRVSDKTGFRKERNPTIVTFPLRHLDMKDYCSTAVSAPAPTSAPVPAAEALHGMTVPQLKAVVKAHGTAAQLAALTGCDKKQLLQAATSACADAVAAAAASVAAQAQKNKYSLLANICRESTQATALQGISVGATTESALSRVSVSNSKAFKIHLQNRPTKQWFELEDLHVTELEPSQIGVSEASILIFESGAGV